jgi:hypothetical protein
MGSKPFRAVAPAPSFSANVRRRGEDDTVGELVHSVSDGNVRKSLLHFLQAIQHALSLLG